MDEFKKWWIEYRGFDDPYSGQAQDAWNAALDLAARRPMLPQLPSNAIAHGREHSERPSGAEG